MTTYEQYLAAKERLRRVEKTNNLLSVYGNCQNLHMEVRFDKGLVYDALHDATPATMEWLREIGGVEGEPGSELIRFGNWITVWPWKSGIEVNLFGRCVLTNPTRGQVLMLLSVSGEGK